jgi:hypothetical protein
MVRIVKCIFHHTWGLHTQNRKGRLISLNNKKLLHTRTLFFTIGKKQQSVIDYSLFILILIF